MKVGTAKVSKIARAYVTAGSPCGFRGYLIRSTKGTGRSLPLASNRHGLAWFDPTGETACHRVDPSKAVDV